ncbi:MAG TPA: transposase [Chthoniobacterales bacterium]|nr:transposase [Chthoniobacterales bacterium]
MFSCHVQPLGKDSSIDFALDLIRTGVKPDSDITSDPFLLHEETRDPGIKEQAAQIIISEVGLDMRPWKTEKQFSSFLGLCPNHLITGGKVLRRATRKVYNRTADTLRLYAQSLTHSKSALGAKYRRLRARLGAPKAIVAMAHHLARLVYRMRFTGKTMSKRVSNTSRNTGVSGRKPIFEMLVVDDELKVAVQERAPATHLKRLMAEKRRENTLFEKAVREAGAGVISLEEACKFKDQSCHPAGR